MLGPESRLKNLLAAPISGVEQAHSPALDAGFQDERRPMFGKGGMGNLMKQAQQMQERMQKMQEQLAQMEVVGEAALSAMLFCFFSSLVKTIRLIYF